MNPPIYLDYAATTPMCTPALEALFHCLGKKADFGNPHSTSHVYGQRAAELIAEAADCFAAQIGATPAEILWTSGATEANNLAIQGLAQFYKTRGKHLITTQAEHKAVLDVFLFLEKEGFSVTYLPVQQNGLVNLQLLRASLRKETLLVSIMTVNNELGTIQPIQEIADIVKAHDAFFHTDASQALGKIPFDVRDLNIDLASFSAHKTYGPKGVGALFINRRSRLHLKPLFYGGGQQRGLRPGTEPPGLIRAFAQGAYFTSHSLIDNHSRIKGLRDDFLRELQGLPFRLNSPLSDCVPHILNLCFPSLPGEVFLSEIKNHIALSQGSACMSGTIQPSHVLRAIGLNSQAADQSFRFSFGLFTTQEEIKKATAAIKTVLG